MAWLVSNFKYVVNIDSQSRVILVQFEGHCTNYNFGYCNSLKQIHDFNCNNFMAMDMVSGSEDDILVSFFSRFYQPFRCTFFTVSAGSVHKSEKTARPIFLLNPDFKPAINKLIILYLTLFYQKFFNLKF